MSEDETVESLIALLRQHNEGIRGSIHQEPYKGDFFRIFAASFNFQDIPITTGALTDIIVSRAPELVEGPLWENFRTFWRDWTYAWQRIDQCERA